MALDTGWLKLLIHPSVHPSAQQSACQVVERIGLTDRLTMQGVVGLMIRRCEQALQAVTQ